MLFDVFETCSYVLHYEDIREEEEVEGGGGG